MKKVLLLIVVTFLILIGVTGFFCFTEKGVQQAVKIVSSLSSGKVSVKKVSGSLLSGLKFERLAVKTTKADVSLFEWSFNWQPGRMRDKELVVSSLAAHGVEVRLKTAEKPTEQKTPVNLEGLDFTLPFSLLVDHVIISNLTVWNDSGELLTDIEQLAFGLDIATDNICIKELSLSSPKYAAEFDGCMSNSDEWRIDSAGNITLLQGTSTPVTANLQIKGNESRVIAKAKLSSPSPASTEIILYNLKTEPYWDAVVDLPSLNIGDFNLNGLDQGELSLQASLKGDLNSYRGDLHGRVTNVWDNSFSFVFELDGNSKGAHLSSAEITSEFGSVNLSESTVGWEDVISWDISAAVENFNMVVGGSTLTADGKLHSVGSLVPDKNIKGELVINNYTLGIDDRFMKGDAKVSFDESTINLEQLEIEDGQGGLTLNGHFGFVENKYLFKFPLTWQVDIEAREFDPSLILVEYPGQINGNIVSTGSWDKNNITGQAEVLDLKGVVRELPLEASGVVVAKDHFIEIRDITLTSGDSEIDVRGNINETIDMYAHISSPDIGQLIAGAEGALEIHGAVKGKKDEPEIDLNIAGTGIEFSGLGLENLTGRIYGHLSDEQTLEGTVTVDGLTVSQGEIHTATVSFDGTTSAHKVSFHSQMEEGTVDLAIAGSLSEDQVWSGNISSTSLSLRELGDWRQTEQADVVVSAKGLVIEPFCLKSKESALCVELEVDDQKIWAASLGIGNIDLELVNSLVGSDDLFKGVLNGSLAVSGKEKQIREGDIELNLSDGGVEDPEEHLWAEFLQFSRISIAASLNDQQVAGTLDVEGVRGNRVSGEVFVEDLYRPDLTPGDAKLSGTLHLIGPNLSTVPPITAYYVYPTGTLTGDFVLSGSLVSPLAKGDLKLLDGQIDFPPFGAALNDVTFGLKWDERTLYIKGEGNSGEGRLYADGSLAFNPGDFYGEFNFSGENIDTFDLPEYEITTSPDLRLIFDTEGGILTGDLGVPRALITPERMSNSLSQSGDIVFVDEEIESGDGDWIFKILIGVNLGEDVKLDSFGIKGDLEGNLQVEKMGGNFTTGRGELTLQEGTFSIYGRSMDIERGRVFFSGGPIEDAGFDVRAQKVVSSKLSGAEGIKVGVDVSGTADDLEFNLFSDPYMEDSDILAYMVIGRPISGSNESEENILSSAAMALGLNRGTGLIQDLTSILPVDDVYFEGDSSEEDVSLVVGKNLTKELFVGYDHNFFDQQGEVTIRYDLGNGFYVESRTSADATGADILYSFER